MNRHARDGMRPSKRRSRARRSHCPSWLSDPPTPQPAHPFPAGAFPQPRRVGSHFEPLAASCRRSMSRRRGATGIAEPRLTSSYDGRGSVGQQCVQGSSHAPMRPRPARSLRDGALVKEASPRAALIGWASPSRREHLPMPTGRPDQLRTDRQGQRATGAPTSIPGTGQSAAGRPESAHPCAGAPRSGAGRPIGPFCPCSRHMPRSVSPSDAWGR